MKDRMLRALRDRAAYSLDHPSPTSRSGRSAAHAGPVSRRRFLRSTGGLAVAGAALGRQILDPQVLHAAGDDPLPLPVGTPALGGVFRFFGPTPDGSFDPIDAEPSTITNFNGVVGLAYISGMVTRTHIQTGVIERLPFNGADMRFMHGTYLGVDGKPRRGAFALI